VRCATALTAVGVGFDESACMLEAASVAGAYCFVHAVVNGACYVCNGCASSPLAGHILYRYTDTYSPSPPPPTSPSMPPQPPSPPVPSAVPNSNPRFQHDDTWWVWSAAVGALVLLLAVLALAWRRCTQQQSGTKQVASSDGPVSKALAQPSVSSCFADAEQGLSKTKDATVTSQSATTVPPSLVAFENYEYPSADVEMHTFIGSGGFGTVFRAHLCRPGFVRPVAAKMLRFTTPKQHSLGIATLKREFRALEKFHHAYIVELVGVVVDDPTFCLLLMELAPLGSLSQVLEEASDRITSSHETQLVLALHIASAMAFLHRQMPPVLHHDLKTANVLLWDQPVFVAKICDFGLVTGTGESTVTAAGGARGGTLHYKPPESFQGNTGDYMPVACVRVISSLSCEC